LIERLYLRTFQTQHVTGTDPDDGGHMTLRIGWNDPTGDNRPIFCVIMQHSQSTVRARMLLSPAQMLNFVNFAGDAVDSQTEKFGHIEPLDYDTRYTRTPDEVDTYKRG
jgi:hypothetical protein